jgi:diguanylate cyclase (GGDEF)-like protein
MRRLSPALRGRISRRAIVHSPHTWNVTAVVLVVFAISDYVLAVRGSDFDPQSLVVVATYTLLIGIAVAFTRPPERGTIGSHLVVAAIYSAIALAVWAHAPQGSGPVITGMFIPVLIALWIQERHHAALHVIAASALMLTAALSGTNDSGTLVAVLCFIPASALVVVVCTLVLDAMEAQGDALDVLALRDPLTGVGNRRMLEAELDAELTRHRSVGRSLAVVEVGLEDFAALNDRVGRAAGDAVLNAIARALTDRAPAGTTITRCEADRFVLILPGSTADRARDYVAAVRASVPTHAGTQPLALTAGIAVHPADGAGVESLMTAAHAARAADDAATRPASTPTNSRPSAPWTLVLTGLDLAPPPSLPRRVSRVDIARDRLIWRCIGAAVVFYAVALTSGHLMWPELSGDGLPFVAAVAVAFGIAGVLTTPPRIGTPRNHIAIAASYLLPFAAMLTAAPKMSWLVGAAILPPLLVAVRLTDRRHVLAHLGFAAALYLGLAFSGAVDKAGTVALLALTMNTCVLGICTAVVMEAAEAQWREIEGLLLRDPLTGVGNRDLLQQRITEELPRHDALQLPLALVELDLIGFDDVLRRDGRGMANQALRDAAIVIRGAVGPEATVARVDGSTFRILLPLADLDEFSADRMEDLLDQLRGAVTSTSRRGRTILPRIGVAIYPDDGVTPEALEAVVSQRRTATDVRGSGNAAYRGSTSLPHSPNPNATYDRDAEHRNVG